MNRRRALLLAALAAPVAYLAAKRPAKTGGAHARYFEEVQQALRKAGLFRPTLTVDRQQLAHNIERLKANMPKNQKYRIVAKSLPSVPLLREVRAATGTDRLMVFHQPHMNFLAGKMPDTQWLLGKPMPAGAMARFFTDFRPGAFEPARQIEWLVDTPRRLTEYRDLAATHLGRRRRLRVNLEIDVGLHRGGFTRAAEVAELLRLIKADPQLEFSGFMGYEAHCSKVPEALGGPRGALDKVLARYREFLAAAQEALGEDYKPETMTLNAGGSTTYELYDDRSPSNELAIGSALVKPTDFDTATLADHQPASYIATPVLKHLPRTDVPGLEGLTGLVRAWNPNTAQTFFIYGGYWLADPVSPPGLQRNWVGARSTNQDWLTGSTDVALEVGDFVFFRPHQSEAVFLQFGDIAVYDRGQIVDFWPVFPS
jgi:D-serine deaminase-like pyridoxal phosphate-dependent protein